MTKCIKSCSKFLKMLIVVGSVIGIQSVLTTNVLAETVQGDGIINWSHSPIYKLNEFSSQNIPKGTEKCSGSMTMVEVVGYDDFQSACVYGGDNEKRFARIDTENNEQYYAFAFASDVKFHKIEGFCVGWVNCVYSPSEDVMYGVGPAQGYVSPLLRVEMFSDLLVLEGIPQQSHFRVTSLNSTYVSDGLGGNLGVRAIGVSENGRWLALEAFGNSIVRIDVRTGEIVKLAPLKAAVNFAGIRGIGVAVSNDGRWVVMTGQSNQITLYEIADGCGYFPTFNETTSYCHSIDVDEYGLFMGYNTAYNPKFSADGMQLTVRVDTTFGKKRATLTPEGAISYQNVQYLAFGDSFSSGQGETSDEFYLPGTNTETNKCHVSSRSYPYLVAQSWEYTALNYACSGAKIDDVKAAIKDVATNQGSVIVSSVGIGGNDIGMMGKLQSCISLGTCDWAQQGNRVSTANEIKRQLPRLIKVIQQLQSSTGSTVFVVGYPLIINSDENAQCSLFESSMFTYEERQYMNAMLGYLNSILQTAANYTDAIYIKLEDSFIGGRLCDGETKYMNTIRIGDDMAPIAGLPDMRIIGAESFHPTPEGYAAMARTFGLKAGNFWETGECIDCANNSAVSDYWTMGATLGQLSTYAFLENFMKTTSMTAGALAEFEFDAGTFAANSQVALEIHSDTTSLGVYTTNNDGSLTGSVIIPNTIETGEHTIHAKSESTSGDLVDYYESVYIGDATEAVNTGSDGLIIQNNKNAEDIFGSQLANLQANPLASLVTTTTKEGVLGTQNEHKNKLLPLFQLPYKQSSTLLNRNEGVKAIDAGLVLYIIFSVVFVIGVCLFLFRVEWGRV